jgi:hypothetical protein
VPQRGMKNSGGIEDRLLLQKSVRWSAHSSSWPPRGFWSASYQMVKLYLEAYFPLNESFKCFAPLERNDQAEARRSGTTTFQVLEKLTNPNTVGLLKFGSSIAT